MKRVIKTWQVRPALRHADTDTGLALSRRSFLLGCGALMMSACGGGEGAPSTAGTASTASALSVSGADADTSNALASAESVASSPAMVHPGLLHTQVDFGRMSEKVGAQVSPWVDGWNVLIANSHASLGWTPRPQAVVYRGSDGVHSENYRLLYNDIAAAYACALRWKVSADTAYADKAVQIMNAWSSTLTGLGGDTNAALAAGIYGYEFANVGEIMRDYAGWQAPDFARFQAMMRNVFYPVNHDFVVRHNNTEVTHYWANWDLCNMASIMAIGVLCDDRALFDEAVAYFKNGAGNGAIRQAVYYVHPGNLGQWQESGRDQGHNTLGIALMGAICEMAWNQGIDLYGYDNNRFLAGAEYVAKANLRETDTTFYTVPYITYNNVDNVNQTALSTAAQGNIRPCWAVVANHYVNRKGMAAPYSQKFAAQIQPEGGGGNYGPNSGGYDQLGYGTLAYTREAIGAGTAPSGLTGVASAGSVVLSWWGTAYATGYTVKRSASPGGPYTVVASDITDPLTWTDNTATASTWYYVVTATTPSGETSPSNEVRVVTGLQLHTWLPLDDATGTTAADASGGGHDGRLQGDAIWTGGRSDTAVSLNGSNAYVALPADILADVSDFTITAWVQCRALRNWTRLFDFGDGTGRYMMFTPRAGNGLPRFAITLNGYSGERHIDGVAAFPVGQWVHVAVTLSGKGGALYINGSLSGQNADLPFAPWHLGGTRQNWLGRSQFSADPYLNGLVDEFRIYRGAMSAAQVAGLVGG
ncbi:LamG-like jellyroll fold domain-containing protein [Cupriavidus necator]